MDNALGLVPLESRFLVIRANAFTKKIDDGYVRVGSRRVGDLMSPAEIAAYIAEHPEARIDVLYV